MLLLLFICIYSAFSLSSDYYISPLKLKCEWFFGKSFYYQNLCYLIIDANSAQCSQVFPMFDVVKLQLTNSKLKQLSFLNTHDSTFERGGITILNGKDQICVFSSPYYCPPDSTLIGSKCYYLNKEKRYYEEAIDDCKYKGMQMFYPHSDKDIKTVIELSSGSGINEIWLSAVRNTSRNWDMNDDSSTFDYARWFGCIVSAKRGNDSPEPALPESVLRMGKNEKIDTTMVTKSSKKLSTKLTVGNNHNVPIGYMSAVKHSSTLRLPTICSSIPLTEPIAAVTTSTKSTTTTTTTTTTKQARCEDDSWTITRRRLLNVTSSMFCFKLLPLPDPYRTTWDEAAPICTRIGASVAKFTNQGDENRIVAIKKMGRTGFNHKLVPFYAYYDKRVDEIEPVIFAMNYNVENGLYQGGIHLCDGIFNGVCTPARLPGTEFIGIACEKEPI